MMLEVKLEFSVIFSLCFSGAHQCFVRCILIFKVPKIMIENHGPILQPDLVIGIFLLAQVVRLF